MGGRPGGPACLAWLRLDHHRPRPLSAAAPLPLACPAQQALAPVPPPHPAPAPCSYIFQPENALPIGTFIDDPQDQVCGEQGAGVGWPVKKSAALFLRCSLPSVGIWANAVGECSWRGLPPCCAAPGLAERPAVGWARREPCLGPASACSWATGFQCAWAAGPQVLLRRLCCELGCELQAAKIATAPREMLSALAPPSGAAGLPGDAVGGGEGGGCAQAPGGGAGTQERGALQRLRLLLRRAAIARPAPACA